MPLSGAAPQLLYRVIKSPSLALSFAVSKKMWYALRPSAAAYTVVNGLALKIADDGCESPTRDVAHYITLVYKEISNVP